MFSSPKQTQQTFLQQECYLPILFETFLTARKAEGVSRGTLHYYREKITVFLAFCEAQAITQIQDVTPDLLRRFMLKLAETHNPGGQHGFYRAVRAFLRFVEAEEVSPDWRSPTRKVKAPRVELQPIEGAPLEDISALLETCNRNEWIGARDTALLLALLDTGARVTEFLSIDTGDVQAGTILLRHTKGKRPREVYLSTRTRKALRGYLRMRHDAHPALWVTKDADRLTYDGLRAILTRRARSAGLAVVPSPHDFRRAMAINYLRNGGDVFTLALILGHKSLTVLRRYLALTERDTQEAHARFSPVDKLK
jgi:site-specific recombinase XerD